jgi:hypothetical protein
MWVFLNDAMFSIVEHREDPTCLVVRARVREDLQRVFPKYKMYTTPDADYRFRVFIDREKMAEILADEVRGIDYGNFKDSIDSSDHIRKYAYTKVWEAMFRVQEELYETGKEWWKTYRYGNTSKYVEQHEKHNSNKK